MGYCEAMEAAGAKVLAMKEFGSYQGEWYALIDYQGERGWVNGWYGSCSGCDAFEAEFSNETHYSPIDDEYHSQYDDPIDGCALCAERPKRLADFGKTYLVNILTKEEALKEAYRNCEWDASSADMQEFINTTDSLFASAPHSS